MFVHSLRGNGTCYCTRRPGFEPISQGGRGSNPSIRKKRAAIDSKVVMSGFRQEEKTEHDSIRTREVLLRFHNVGGKAENENPILSTKKCSSKYNSASVVWVGMAKNWDPSFASQHLLIYFLVNFQSFADISKNPSWFLDSTWTNPKVCVGLLRHVSSARNSNHSLLI